MTHVHRLAGTLARVLIAFLIAVSTVLSFSDSGLAQNQATSPELAFVGKYCTSCHGESLQEADRRFDDLSASGVTADQAEAWHEILGRLNLGDMPPADAPMQPSAKERIEMVERLTAALSDAAAADRSEQTVFRRLNRAEYDAAMRAALGLEAMLSDPTADFTPDEAVENFRNVGQTLVLSDFLLNRYLDSSNQYLDFARALATANRANARPETIRLVAPFCRSMPNPDGLDRPGEYQHIRENATDNFGYVWFNKLRRGVKRSGNYRIKVRASAINRAHPYEDYIIRVPIEDPIQMSIVAGDTRQGDMASNNPTDRVLAVMDIEDDAPKWYETTAWLDKHWQPRLGYPNGPVRIKYMRHMLMRDHRDLFPRFLKDHVHVFHDMHPDYDKKTAPAMVEKFLAEQEELRKAGKPYDVFGIDHRLHTTEAWNQFYSEYRGPRIRVFEVEIEGPLAANGDKTAKVKSASIAEQMFPENFQPNSAGTLIAKLANRAWRRPAKDAELAPFTQLFEEQVENGQSPSDALQIAYQAVLCSPSFLYHRTRAGELDQYEFANRLSFFLWGTPADKTLIQLAAAGQLRAPATLKQQISRMLDDPRNETMIANFTDAWLQLSKLGTMLPNREEHPKYFNERLEDSMRTETRMFFQDAISHNAHVSVLVDSDYSFLNASLARLYQIDGVEGHEFQRVALPDHRRGGLLGQASVLTATANGIDTSPVVRGVWVLECLLGTPPADPPPDIEPIEPDIRGATTIREQLAKHRHVATCNHCHRRIDPPGFALEAFDEIGQYRDRYVIREGWRETPGQPIDCTGTLSSGESFSDVAQMKTLLMERLDLVATNLASKLLTHATGRIDDPQDKADILGIVSELAKESQVTDYQSLRKQPGGIRIATLIQKIVSSDAFAR